jgi:hypothetical protein
MFVYKYVCMYICTYVCTTYVRMYICMYVTYDCRLCYSATVFQLQKALVLKGCDGEGHGATLRTGVTI